jgi:hypothetical protein
VRNIALALGALLCGIGILHDIINVRSVTRAIARGEIAERMGAQLVANVVLAGLALVILGSFLLLIASDLEKGKRSAWRRAFVVGVFLTLSGVAAYLWLPRPSVLIFSAVGLVLTGPLLLWRSHFLGE